LTIVNAEREVDLGRARLLLGNALALLPGLTGCYHAIVSDPPYGIGYDPSRRRGSTSRWADVPGIAGDDCAFDPRHLVGRVALGDAVRRQSFREPAAGLEPLVCLGQKARHEADGFRRLRARLVLAELARRA
jgi:hypothetical protein